jgi:endonuclease/exonuclease/phosphatase family metal-dependent hydrolase
MKKRMIFRHMLLGWILSVASLFAQQWGYPGCTNVPGDYNGDGKADLAAYCPTDGKWFIYDAENASIILWDNNWGYSGTIAVSGDYDGDGISDQAIYDPANLTWYIKTVSGTILAWNRSFGTSGCVPVAGDYNGDGESDLALYQLSSGMWYIQQMNGQYITNGGNWGYSGCVPVSGDFNGDGSYDLAVFDTSACTWYIRSIIGGALYYGTSWGGPTMRPVSGDVNGDGKSDLILYDYTQDKWFSYITTATPYSEQVAWGHSNSIPIMQDYDGDGRSEYAVLYPNSYSWSICRTNEWNSKIRFMTFNIAYSCPWMKINGVFTNANFGDYINRLADYIIVTNAQIIGLQEVPMNRDNLNFFGLLLEKLAEKGYGMTGYVKDQYTLNVSNIYLGNAILSRYPIETISNAVYKAEHIYWDGKKWVSRPKEHVIQAARILIPDRTTIRVINHHPHPGSSSDSVYQNQLAYESGLYTNEDSFLLGDFNQSRYLYLKNGNEVDYDADWTSRTAGGFYSAYSQTLISYIDVYDLFSSQPATNHSINYTAPNYLVENPPNDPNAKKNAIDYILVSEYAVDQAVNPNFKWIFAGGFTDFSQLSSDHFPFISDFFIR